jgi:hypothetical protein
VAWAEPGPIIPFNFACLAVVQIVHLGNSHLYRFEQTDNGLKTPGIIHQRKHRREQHSGIKAR